MAPAFSNVGGIEVDGQEYVEDGDRPQTNIDQVTPGFFALSGQRLIAGRTFTDQDQDGRQPVAIVNAASTFGPARRATRLDPMAALRAE